jgi:hypothetical protein
VIQLMIKEISLVPTARTPGCFSGDAYRKFENITKRPNSQTIQVKLNFVHYCKLDLLI